MQANLIHNLTVPFLIPILSSKASEVTSSSFTTKNVIDTSNINHVVYMHRHSHPPWFNHSQLLIISEQYKSTLLVMHFFTFLYLKSVYRKATFTPMHWMKVYRVANVQLHSCTTSATDGWKVISLTPRSLFPLGKSPRHPMNRRLGGPQSRSGCFGEISDHSPTVQTRIAQPVVQSLHRLRYLLSKSEYSSQYSAVKCLPTNNTVF